MGRTLEALKQGGSKRKTPAVTAPTAAPAGPDDALATQPGEEVPFIEVGGPRASVQASGILRVPARPARKGTTARPLAVAPLPCISTGSADGTGEPVPTNVAFWPLPGASPAAARERFGRELVAFHQPEHALSEQYRGLLASLMTQLPAGEPLALLFTCGASEAGKTTVLLNLAITCARQGKSRVAVVDAGGSQGAVARKLGMPQAPGLREVLANTVSLQRALAETGHPNFCVLPAGSEAPEADAGPAGGAVRPVLRQLREHFDLLLVDGPTWDGGPGTAALGAACDAVYLVVRQAEVKTTQVEDLLFRIPQRGSRLCGYILTQP